MVVQSTTSAPEVAPAPAGAGGAPPPPPPRASSVVSAPAGVGGEAPAPPPRPAAAGPTSSSGGAADAPALPPRSAAAAPSTAESSPSLGSAPGTPVAAASAAEVEEKRAKRAAHREKIVAEIRDTEDSYVTKLRAMDTLLAKPLIALAKKGDTVIPEAMVTRIFAHIANILELNAGLLRQLEARKPDESLGMIFVAICPYLKLYSSFINAYSDAMSSLSDAMAVDKFVQFYAEASQHPMIGGLSLPSLLIMPVQRIPRYELLLRDLLKYTEDDHPDKPALEDAMAKIVVLAKQVNESKERQERMHAVWMIQKRFAAKPAFEPFVQPHRRFLREDVLTKKPSSGKAGRDRERTFFLFNDIIVYAAQAGKKLEFKGRIELLMVRIANSAENPTTGFDLISSEGTFRCTCPDEKTRDIWVKEVSALQEELHGSLVNKVQHLSGRTQSTVFGPNEDDEDEDEEKVRAKSVINIVANF